MSFSEQQQQQQLYYEPLLEGHRDSNNHGSKSGMFRQKHQRLPAHPIHENSNNSDDIHDENDNNVDSLFRVTEQQHHQSILLYDNNDRNNFIHSNLPWYQQSQQVSAMISNFSTSYNVVNVSLVLPILKVALQQQAVPVENESSWWTSPQQQQQQQEQQEALLEDAEAAVASSLLAGMMVGQVLGGILGDIVGASVALRCVMMLQIVASIGSSSSLSSSSTARVYWQLAAWRFLLGIGAGGVYPLAAVLSASPNTQPQNDPDSRETEPSFGDCSRRMGDQCNEVSEEHNVDYSDHDDEENCKLHRVVLTFSTQGLGFLMVPLVAIPLLYYFPNNLNFVWRFMLGLGSLPGVFLLLWQWCALFSSGIQQSSVPHQLDELQIQEESTRIEFVQQSDGSQVDSTAESDDIENESILESVADRNDFHDALEEIGDESPSSPTVGVSPISEPKSFWKTIRNEENLVRKLLGTAATWFLFDVLFYGNTLFQPIVIEAAFGARDHSDPVHLLQRTAIDSLILTLIALPGYVVASLVLGKRTRWCYCGVKQTPRFVMLQGFTAMATLYLAIGSAWNTLRRFPTLLVLLYSLTFFFANYGPNTTTFVLPNIVFAPECRSTFNGLSAAAGKLGALTGASLFEPAADRLGDASVMLICASISIVALIMTKYFVPLSMHPGHDGEMGRSPATRHVHVRISADSELS
jgi:MFS transporter, PHS family, inorganic phosphate transporter